MNTSSTAVVTATPLMAPIEARDVEPTRQWRSPWEVDAVFEGSWGDWAVEVKTGRFDLNSLKGLLEFSRRYPKFPPLVITAPGDEIIAQRHGLAALSWKEFLLSGPPSRAPANPP